MDRDELEDGEDAIGVFAWADGLPVGVWVAGSIVNV